MATSTKEMNTKLTFRKYEEGVSLFSPSKISSDPSGWVMVTECMEPEKTPSTSREADIMVGEVSSRRTLI